jgi:hypothetical protein
MDLTNASWRKSSFSSGNGGNCIEVAELPGMVAVRDSKDPEGPALVLEPSAFAALTSVVRSGKLAP